MSTFEEDRSRLSGLHFAQDAMRPHERETLHLAEAMLHRLDAALALHRQHTFVPACVEDEQPWPCATVRAITRKDNT